MTKFKLITLFLIFSFVAQTSWALGTLHERCFYNEDRAQRIYKPSSHEPRPEWVYVDALIYDRFVDILREKAPEQGYNSDIVNNFWPQLEAQHARPRYHDDVYSNFSYDHLEGCINWPAVMSETLRSLPDDKKQVKQWGFKLNYFFYGTDFINLDQNFPHLNTVISKGMGLEGTIITDARCENPIQCDDIHIVYIHKVVVELDRVSPAGGSSSAGGILFQ
jgi:hypothetical protein